MDAKPDPKVKKESLFDVLRLFDGTKKGGWLFDLWQLLLGKVTIDGRNVDDRRHRRHRVIARHQRGVQRIHIRFALRCDCGLHRLDRRRREDRRQVSSSKHAHSEMRLQTLNAVTKGRPRGEIEAELPLLPLGIAHCIL